MDGRGYDCEIDDVLAARARENLKDVIMPMCERDRASGRTCRKPT
jgi:hypothetical protein